MNVRVNNLSATTERRASSLDALRGYAILTMVLSATVVFGILPAWMYHMQEPPPTHVFQPERAGLTWVDLVFPFFLFAMGAAFPFSVGKKMRRGVSVWKLGYEALKRGVQLTFFAIFIQHFYPYMLSSPQDTRAWLLAIACFLVLFPMFMRIPLLLPEWLHLVIKLGAYAVAVCMMTFTDYAAEASFSFFTSNIIILLLANMAMFGTWTYMLTYRCGWQRVLVMVGVMGFSLSAGVQGSWAELVYNYSPFPWAFRFEYLRYLCIVLSGSLAGDLLLRWMQESTGMDAEPSKGRAVLVGVLCLLVILTCLVGLYQQADGLTFLICLGWLLIGWIALSGYRDGTGGLWRSLWMLGIALLLVGFLFEPFQGGIKKDGPTIGYLLITAGLATMALIAFHIVCDYFRCHRATAFLTMSGQNPMIAYVACDLLIYPLLGLTGLRPYLEVFASNPWLGFLQGVLLTALAMLVTMFFTRIKWFWRT